MKSPSRRTPSSSPSGPVLHSPPKPRVPLMHSPPKNRSRPLPPPGSIHAEVSNGDEKFLGGGQNGSNGHPERPRFETFTMTGDMILNLSKTPQYPPPVVGTAGKRPQKVVHSPPGVVNSRGLRPSQPLPPPGAVVHSPPEGQDHPVVQQVGSPDACESLGGRFEEFGGSAGVGMEHRGGGGGGGGSAPTSPRDTGAGEGAPHPRLMTRDDAASPPAPVSKFRGSRSEDRLQDGDGTALFEDTGGSFNTLLDTSEASTPSGDVPLVTAERDGRAVWTVNAPADSVPPTELSGGDGSGHSVSNIPPRGVTSDAVHLRLANPSPHTATTNCSDARSPVSPESDEGSDIESLHSFHFSPKAVDLPSAVRLAKRLYHLDGFRKSDVSRHLSKNNEFNRTVADEYLRHFEFSGQSLDVALGAFLDKFALTGETQERERVLVHFSRRYVQNNPRSFNSPDACHTLTCALMLLNTDLHVQHVPRKMTCAEFVDNLADLNDGEDFPRETLKALYQAIKATPLHYATDDEYEEMTTASDLPPVDGGTNPFLEIPDASKATEYKRGYVMRKCCVEPNGKRTALGKRSWRMFYCTLRDLVLYMHKDENTSRKPGAYDDLHNAIRVHHALATKAEDYFKKQHVFKLETADRAQYLLQTSDAKELQAWIDTINFCAASLSAPPLPGAVGSQKRFQRPLLPSGITKRNLHDQLVEHEKKVTQTEAELASMEESPPGKGAKAQAVHVYKEKFAFLRAESVRYRTYSQLLRSKMAQYPQLDATLLQSTAIGELEEEATVAPLSAAAGTTASDAANREQHQRRGGGARTTESEPDSTGSAVADSVSEETAGQSTKQELLLKKKKKKGPPADTAGVTIATQELPTANKNGDAGFEKCGTDVIENCSDGPEATAKNVSDSGGQVETSTCDQEGMNTTGKKEKKKWWGSKKK